MTATMIAATRIAVTFTSAATQACHPASWAGACAAAPPTSYRLRCPHAGSRCLPFHPSAFVALLPAA